MLVEFVVPNTARAPADVAWGQGGRQWSGFWKPQLARVDGGRQHVMGKYTLNGTQISTEAEHDSVTVTPGKRRGRSAAHRRGGFPASLGGLSPISSGTHLSPPRCLPRRSRVRWRSHRPDGSPMACQSTADSCGRERTAPAEFSLLSRVVF